MSDFQSKIIEVKHLVTEVTDLFIKQKSVLDSMSETISKFGKGAKLPSEFSNAQKEVNKNLEKQSDLQKKIEQNAKNQSKAMQNLAMQDWKTQEEALKKEEKIAQQNIKNVKARLSMIASLNKQRYEQEAKLISDNDKALTFQSEKELSKIKAKLAIISSLNKQRYTEEEKLAQDNEKAMLHKHQEELRQIKAKQALIYSLGQQRMRQEAQDAKDGRIGASSTIPGMGAKISDLKENERQALANEKLNRAYVQLSATREKAKNKLQDLIASEKASNNEIRQAQKEFDVLNKKVAAADKAVGRFSDANRKINGLSQSVGNLMTAFGISTGIYLAVDIAKNIYETTKQLQSLDLALKMVSGSQEEFVSNQVFLKSLAEQYGIEIKGLTKNFTEFWVASKGKLEAEQIKEIFTSISKSVAVMGLSVEQQDSAFLALQQMMSKGTVQAEELKKQLGNALPGAIKAATMAYQTLHPEMKVTEKFFMEQMKAGKVLSSELLPELAKAYEKLYGIENVKRAETLQAAQERLANSWTDMVRSLNESKTGGISKFFALIIDGATDAMEQLRRLNSAKQDLFKDSRSKGNAQGQNAYNKKFDELVGDTMTDKKRKNIRQQIKDTEELIKAGYDLDQAGEKNSEKLRRLHQAMGTGSAEEVNLTLRKDAYKNIVIQQKKLNELKAEYENYSVIADGKGGRALNDIQAEREEANRLLGYYEAISKAANSYKAPTVKTGDVVEKEKKGRDNDSAERDRLALLEKNAKIEYDLAISNAEIKRDIIKSEYEDFKGSIQGKIKLSQKLALAEKTIIDLKEKESKRKAVDEKGKTDDRLFKIAENESFGATGKVLEDNTKRVQDIFKDHFNELEKMPDSIFGDKYKLTPEQEKELDKIKKLTEKSREDVRNYINSFTGDAANNLGFQETFDFFLKMDEDGKTMWQKLDSYAEGSKEKQVATFQAIAESAQEVYNFMSNLSQKRYEKDYERLEKDKENALKFAGDNETQKKRIEEQYEKRRKEIARKEFNAKKQQAIVNIAIDTAQAIVGLWVKPGFPAAIPMAIAMAGLGAVQAGFVAAQKPPEFYVGTQNAPEGLAYTNERGAELHTDKKGNIKDFGDNKGARLTMLEAGDKIYTAEQTKRILFNDELNNILTSNNIMPSSINIQSNGVSATQMDAIIGKHFSNIQTNHTSIDKNGWNTWTEKNGNKTISDNNRVQRKGLIIK